MATKNRYFSRVPSCKFIFKSGKEAAFVGGIFDTDFASEIKELDEEVATGHPHIFVNVDQLTIDSECLDPLTEIKRKAIEEYIAAQVAASDPKNNRGNTKETKLNTVTTADIAAASADSSSGQAVAETGAAPSVIKIGK